MFWGFQVKYQTENITYTTGLITLFWSGVCRIETVSLFPGDASRIK